MALEGEGLATKNAKSGEDAPTGEESGLTGREAHLFDGKQAAVVDEVAVNHGWLSGRRGRQLFERLKALSDALRAGSSCEDAVLREFDFADTSKSEQQANKIFWRILRGLPDDLRHGRRDRVLEGHRAHLKTGEIYTHHRAWLKHTRPLLLQRHFDAPEGGLQGGEKGGKSGRE